MLAVGAGALRRYPGLAVTLYGVQLVIATVAAWVMAACLAAAFATQPLFDRAVTGDTLAIAVLLDDNLPVAAAVLAAGLGAAMLYAAVSWFLAGGLIATLVQRPTGRRAVAELFGAAGAATFFPYLRLWLWSLIPYLLAALALAVGLACVHDDLRRALTLGEVLSILSPTALPAAILIWLTALAVGYARVRISIDRDTSAVNALVGGYWLALTRWRALVHSLIFVLAWTAITLLYLVSTEGHAMAGIAGALLLFALRQVTAMLRLAAKIAFVGGQVELATRAPRGRGYVPKWLRIGRGARLDPE